MIKKTKTMIGILFMVFLVVASSCGPDKIIYHEDVVQEGDNNPGDLELNITVPAGPNSWVVNSLEQDEVVIHDNGIHNWTSLDDVIRTYIKTGTGQLNVGFNMKSAEGISNIKVTVNGNSKTIEVSNSEYDIVEVGSFNVSTGYNAIEIQAIDKSGTYIGDIDDILLGGPAANSSNFGYVPLDNFHFGRRGPSVNIGYQVESSDDIRWFYNEVTVPEGEDVLGSFFMANGHQQGYFGIQVNSETERRVLFSIWSAFDTNDPNQIPEEYKVTELGRGDNVTVQNFGNEGSGMQSFRNVNWVTDETYKFLLKGEPSNVAGSTDYTAYFFNPAVGEWELIASLRRPQTVTYLKGIHSFLENFNPSTGFIDRQAQYGNQWVYTTNNEWKEITRATFGVDATAANGDRFDYAGGGIGNAFFMKNCGFFNENTNAGLSLTRASTGTAPDIDFSSLPQVISTQSKTILDKTNWKIEAYSSQEDQGGEGETGLASDVLDGNLESYWHSCWNSCTATPPHFITIDLGAETESDGLRFSQRQSLSRAVKDIEIEFSNDNSNWTSIGAFALLNETTEQDVDFGSPHTFRFLKFIAKSAHDGTNNAAMAEISTYKYE